MQEEALRISTNNTYNAVSTYLEQEEREQIIKSTHTHTQSDKQDEGRFSAKNYTSLFPIIDFAHSHIRGVERVKGKGKEGTKATRQAGNGKGRWENWMRRRCGRQTSM